MDIGAFSDPTPHPPTLSTSSPFPFTSLPNSNLQSIQALETEFQQVRQHIKLLVLKKAKLLREIHSRKQCQWNGITLLKSEEDSINRWKDISTRYLYALDDNNTHKERNAASFPLFNILPSEIVLHIFSFLDATHLCLSLMRVCTLFCAVALDESLWKPLYHRSWMDHRAHIVDNGGSATWRSLFGEQYLTEQNWWRGHNTVNTFYGHKGAVRCMQFTGDTLITGSADKTIKVWNLDDGQCAKTLHDNKWVRCLCFDAATSTLITTGMDSTQAKVWNLNTETVSHVLDVHRGWITSLQLSMPRLVTGSLDGIVRIWDASTGHAQPYQVVNSGHDSMRGLWLVGDLVMSAGLERNLQLWDLRADCSSKPALTIEAAPHGNYCVQFDPYTHVVCSGSKSVVALSDMRAPSSPASLLRGHTDVVSCLQFSGKKLVTGSMDHTIRVWDTTTQSCANTLEGHESWVWDLQFDPDKVVTVSGDKAVKLWAFNHHACTDNNNNSTTTTPPPPIM